MRPITVYGIRSDDKHSIHEVTIPFNKEGVLNALNDALDYGNPYSPDECNEGGEYITIEFYPTRKKAEYVRDYQTSKKSLKKYEPINL